MTYVLIPLVVVIWGVIIWKIFFNKPKVEYKKVASVSSPEVIMELEEKIERVYNYHYQDPFLKTNPKNQKKKPIEPINTPKKLNRVVRWPRIQYKGMVTSKQRKSALAMLEIGDRDYLVRRNDDTENIRVFSITADSIGLKYKNELKYFYLRSIRN